MPLISVVMPVYDESRRELIGSIKSICNQTFTNFEFIIIDDNPKSYKLRMFLLNIRKLDSRLRIYFNKENVGPSVSMNEGILYSRGKFIARMDADDISLKCRLKRQLNFMYKYNLDFSCFNFSLISSNGNLERKDVYSNVTQVDQKKIRHVMSYCSIANGPSFMFKKKIINTVGGYRIKCIEDYDFASRVLINHFRMGYQSKSFIYKRDRPNSISNSNILKQFIGVMLISKYLRKFHFKKIIPLSILNKGINKLSYKDLSKFKHIKKYINILKKTHSFIYFIRMCVLILSSSLILRYCIWKEFINSRQNKLIK